MRLLLAPIALALARIALVLVAGFEGWGRAPLAPGAADRRARRPRARDRQELGRMLWTAAGGALAILLGALVLLARRRVRAGG